MIFNLNIVESGIKHNQANKQTEKRYNKYTSPLAEITLGTGHFLIGGHGKDKLFFKILAP